MVDDNKNSGTQDESVASDFIEKLKSALSSDGDFPASARVVSQLREVISKPNSTTNQVAEIILRELSLGTRVLHLVNSSFYRRSKPILTISQAVIQIGMRPLAELCSGLVLLQKFIPAARKGGPFAQCLKKSITTSLLTSLISAEMQSHASGGQTTGTSALKNEAGYLTGNFAEMGTLLLAYYFPKLYESAEKRSEKKNQSISQSITELVGLSPLEISLEVLIELKLPEQYQDTVSQAIELLKSSEESKQEVTPLSSSLFASITLSRAINESGDVQSIQSALKCIHEKVSLEGVLLSDALAKLSDSFQDYCASLELPLPGLHDQLESFALQENSQGMEEETLEEAVQPLSKEEQFLDFVEEIRTAVDNREPSASIITTVMETFAWSLGFDRVFLMLLGRGKQQLNGRMLLGHIKDFDPKTYSRELQPSNGYAPDSLALKESRPVYRGDPIFDDGWPFAAVPVGFDKRSVGLIYADRAGENEGKELSPREEAAIGVLAELLDRSISLNS